MKSKVRYPEAFGFRRTSNKAVRASVLCLASRLFHAAVGLTVLGAVACLAGCSGDTVSNPKGVVSDQLTGLFTSITTADGTRAVFVPGSLPTGPAPAPTLVLGGSALNSTAVSPDQTLTVDVVTDQPVTDLYFSVDGLDGYYDLPVNDAAASRAPEGHHHQVKMHVSATVFLNQFLLHNSGHDMDGTNTNPGNTIINVIRDDSNNPPAVPFT